MSKQDQLKERFDKNYNYNQILSKMERKKEMKNSWFKYSLVPACLAVIIGFMVFSGNDTKSFTPGNGNEIIINNLKDRGSFLIDDRIDAEAKDTTDFFEKHSFNNELAIPKGMKLNRYCLYVKDCEGCSKEEYMNIKEYTRLADCRLVYSSDNEAGQSIVIAMAEDRNPLRDYFFIDDSLKVSKINGVELKIFTFEGIYNAIFSHNGLNFDVETNGITEKEFINLLESILK